MDRWEYRIADLTKAGKDTGELNELGADGLEPAGMASTGHVRPRWRRVSVTSLMGVGSGRRRPSRLPLDAALAFCKCHIA